MSNSIIPDHQSIFINSSQGRIFDFNTPSSRVYLGDAVNSLLRVFGNNVIITGLRILNVEYLPNDIIIVDISPGETIIDYTLIKYTSPIRLSIDVSGFTDGLIIPNIFFNFSPIQQKNLSTIRLSHVNNDGHVSSSHWYEEYSILILAVIEFDKNKQIAHKRIIPILNREEIKISNKTYTVYPFDNISERILLYLNDTFN